MRLFLLFLFAAIAATPARALESTAVSSPRATATMVTDTDQAASGQPFKAALRLRLAPGWHTYWQNPGDAGVAPELSFDPAGGTAAGPIDWPAPEKVAEGPLTTFAYEGDVLLPVPVTPGAGPTALRAHANWLVCKNVCVPEEGDFALDLPAGQPSPSAETPLFAAASARTPVASPYAAHIAPGGMLTLDAGRALAASVRQAQFFPLGQGIDLAAAQPLSVGDGTLTLKLPTIAVFDPSAELSGLLVLRDEKGGPTYLNVTATPGAGPVSTAATALPEMLLLALAGGLILNLMPCVFPVLAMKAMSLARMSGHHREAVRAHAVSYTAGVVLAFMALGGGLLLLRVAGQAAGWGFQFQSPVFVAMMAWLLFGVGLNLSGVFAVDGGIAGAGQSLAGRGGHVGSFFTGLLAVLVATPCTAPFMGAAIAGALVAPPGITLLVFATMGLGLALPYALLAVVPGLARALPRPGAWMDLLKELLAFPMYAAVVWLVWVVSQEAGSDGVLAVVAGLVLLGFAGWALGRAQRGAGLGRRLGQAAAVAGVAAAALLLPNIMPIQAAAQTASEASEPFSAVRLAELRAQGRPVFVNMTAAWCVSCLVNERVALSTQAVRDAFVAHNVAYLKGDWTRQDPAISSFLREHGRDGVPLYIVYEPGQEPKLLPQVLTPSLVLASFNEAKS